MWRGYAGKTIEKLTIERLVLKLVEEPARILFREQIITSAN